MAQPATQALHPLSKLGEIVMGWAGKLCPDGPWGREKANFNFDGWQPDPNVYEDDQ